jgi:RHS repeat-associated protein
VDYYPFGLTFNSHQRENSVANKFKFQGQELIDDLNLGWDSFKWRNHQPDIGRFFNVDPLAEKYVYNSVYAFSENKVVAHREIEGLEAARADEIGYALLSPYDANKVRNNSEKAFAAARASGLGGARDGRQDAFRHAYWNALNARDIGADDAEPFATRHETGSNAMDANSPEFDPVAVQMDLFNNDVGRRIGAANLNATDDQLAEFVNQALANGGLQMIYSLDFILNTGGTYPDGTPIQEVMRFAVDANGNPITSDRAQIQLLNSNGYTANQNAADKVIVTSSHPSLQPNGTSVPPLTNENNY